MSMNIDKELLKEQITFLYSYAWREQGIPDEIVGIINLLEAVEEDDNEQHNRSQNQNLQRMR